MKHRVLKNTIAILAFILFVLFLMQKFVTKYDNSAMLLKLNNFKADNVEEETIEGTLKEEKASVSEVYERLEPFYSNDNIDLDRIVKAKESEIKEKLIELLNRFAVSDLKEIVGEERINYIKLYDGTKIVGDSNVRHFDYYQVLEKEYYYPLAGKNIEYQTKHAKEYVDNNTKRIIFWNGYNIANYKDAKEYVGKYQALVDKVKEINPEVDVYICSLMPATEKAIEDDFNGDIVHNIYRGKEYDEALKEHFKDKYVNIKFMGKQKYYGNDGIHFMPQFYYMLVPYLAYYLSLEYE